jgi:hypothetical protein
MTYLRVIMIVCTALLCSHVVGAQPGDRYLNMKSQVLNALFPLQVEPKPYLSKMILRFGDSSTQITVVVYPGGKAEIIRHALTVAGAELERIVSSAVAKDSGVKAEEIAANLRVTVLRSAVGYKEIVAPAVAELKSIRLSPILGSHVSVDHFSEYEFWYDTWQESVHYTLNGPFAGQPQDELVKWMLNFRLSVEQWLKNATDRRQ